MNPRYEDVVVYTERNKDLFRQVEVERLAHTMDAGRGGPPLRDPLLRRVASWTGRWMVRWGQRLQVYATNEA
ncbi:MAG: hypothetical protein HY326_02565 [Chloroflexi bacterium]|nr:hypothetical protein [Chloroflexota bacterium]